jgi:hypothetical protein
MSDKNVRPQCHEVSHPDKEQIVGGEKPAVVSRRKLLAIGASGAILACPGAVALVRWWAGPKAAQVAIDGPFRYGVYSLGELNVSGMPDMFELVKLKVNRGGTHDTLHVAFTFAGEEDESRTLDVTSRATGADRSMLARSERTFRDPRIVVRQAPKRRISGVLLHRVSYSTMSLTLPKGTRASDVERLTLELTTRSAAPDSC